MSNVQSVILGVDATSTGKRIQALMKYNGLSMKEVAEGVSVSQQSVWKWCKGQTVPSLDNMVILSRILGVRMDDIVAVNENTGTKMDPAAATKQGWMVTAGREEVHSEKKEGGEPRCSYRHNMFTLSMVSKNKQMKDVVE